MRVLMVSAYPAEEARPHGGIEAAVVPLVRELRGLGAEVYVLNTSITRRRAKCAIMHICTIALKRLWQLGSGVRLSRSGLYDVVHVQGNSPLALVVQTLTSTPVVLTVHGIAEKDVLLRRGWSRFVSWALFRVTEQIARKNVKDIIAISDDQAAWLRNHGARGRIEVIPNAVNVSSVEAEPARPEIVERERYFLFLGRVVPLKQLDLAVAALGTLSPTINAPSLVAAGPIGDVSYARRLHQTAVALGVSLELLGTVDRKTVRALLQGCDALVLTSSQEQTPLVVAEAMALGVPVVATSVGAIPEMLGDYPMGYVVGPSVEEVASVLTQIATGERRQRAMPKLWGEPGLVAAQTYRRYRVAARFQAGS